VRTGASVGVSVFTALLQLQEHIDGWLQHVTETLGKAAKVRRQSWTGSRRSHLAVYDASNFRDVPIDKFEELDFASIFRGEPLDKFEELDFATAITIKLTEGLIKLLLA